MAVVVDLELLSQRRVGHDDDLVLFHHVDRDLGETGNLVHGHVAVELGQARRRDGCAGLADVFFAEEELGDGRCQQSSRDKAGRRAERGAGKNQMRRDNQNPTTGQTFDTEAI